VNRDYARGNKLGYYAAMVSILIVEDQEAIIENIAGIVHSAGYQPVKAESGSIALDKLKNHSIDLILLDLGLPDISGHDLLLRIVGMYPNLPVIVISSMLDMRERLACFEAGADDFIPKPFHPAETLARIDRSLRNKGRGQGQMITHGRLVINYNERLLVIDGQIVAIRNKLFEILYMFVSSPGKILSRRVIANSVWGQDYVSDNSIWVHINQVRKLLESYGWGVGRIETLSGSGYRYIEPEA
jgi:DNA-binding response OmpR family regulator